VRALLGSRRAVSPVLSSLLLAVVAVAAMSIAATATYVITNNLHDSMGERFIVEDVWFRPDGKIDIYVRNVGKVDITVGAVYVNHTSAQVSPLELKVGEHGWLNVTYSWASNSVYYITVVTRRGTKVADYYVAPST